MVIRFDRELMQASSNADDYKARLGDKYTTVYC